MSFLNFNTTVAVFFLCGCLWLWAWGVHGRRRRGRVISRFLGEALAEDAYSSVSRRKRLLRGVFLMFGAALVGVAIARPWWGKHLIPQPSRSRDVLIALDCSKSMLADDVAPSRLAHGKWYIRQLLDTFQGDRFGFIAFAGDAFLECPLTQDRGSLEMILNEIDTSTIPLGGSNLARALEEAVAAFKGAEGSDRAVLLVTDGDELQGDSEQWADKLGQTDTALLIVGLGDPVHGSMIRDPDGKYVRDSDGNLVSSKLAEDLLKKLSRKTGGIYVRSTTVNPNLSPVIERIRLLVPEEGESRVRQREIERFQIPLTGAMGCFLAFMLLGDRKRRRERVSYSPPGLSRGAVIITCLLAGWHLLAEPTLAKSGDIEALEAAIESAASGAEKARLLYNLGRLYQHSKMMEEAVSAYEAALSQADPGSAVFAAATWNLGVCRHEAARRSVLEDPQQTLTSLDEAAAFYRQAMKAAEDPAPIGRNQELLLQDREFARQVKEQLDELSRMQDQAREKTEAAAQAQQDAAAESDPAERRDKEEKAQKAAGQAQQAVENLRRELDSMRQQPEQQRTPVDDAAEAIRQARDFQDRAMDEKTASDTRSKARQNAADELRKAAEFLGGRGKQDTEDAQADSDDETEADNSESDEGDASSEGDQSEIGSGQPSGDASLAGERQEGSEAEGVELDAAQAEAILRSMQRKESELREELKLQRIKNMKVQPVKKDW